ncbi:MAG: hypothetical protein QOJ41_925 [Acidobacteriaceae bacterium]|jgi:hypothetical protein|nr:hypothetical protein [Acidobacteriaceae bacterium]
MVAISNGTHEANGKLQKSQESLGGLDTLGNI